MTTYIKQPPVDSNTSQSSIITISNRNKTSSVTIHPFGATIINWKVDEEEQLFISTQAKWDQTKAIRGGIPLVFPQFGPGKMKQHGFARICPWIVSNETSAANTCILTLTEKELSNDWREQFPYTFILKYTVNIDNNNQLKTALSITNSASKTNDDCNENSINSAFDFTVLFHTYFACSDSSAINIQGLQNKSYLNKVSNSVNKEMITDDEQLLSIDQEIDRIYGEIGNNCDLILFDVNKKLYKKIIIKTTNFADSVVWNPWVNKAMNMSDFADEEYKNMVCIESGNVLKAIHLECGETFCVSQCLIPVKNI